MGIHPSPSKEISLALEYTITVVALCIITDYNMNIYLFDYSMYCILC